MCLLCMKKIWLGEENLYCVSHEFPDSNWSSLKGGENFVPITRCQKNIKKKIDLEMANIKSSSFFSLIFFFVTML
jgi:hypothetical protein